MYQELGLVKEYGRLVYYPPNTAIPLIQKQTASACRSRWSNLFIPRDMRDWAWMMVVYEKMNYSDMWIPLKEDKENEGTYYWQLKSGRELLQVSV